MVANFLRSADPRPVLSWRALAADTALAAVVTVAALVNADAQYQGSDVRVSGLAVLGVALTAAPLAIRRRYPMTAFLLIVAAVAATSQEVTTTTFLAVIFAGYCAVLYSRFRGAALLGLLAVAIIVTAAFPNTTPPLPGRYTALLVLAPTAAVACAVRLWRSRAGASAERLRQAQALHAAQTQRAIAQERARIVRELHDVVAHNVSVMTVQAGAARRALSLSPDEARDALLAVEASGRTAMTELRHLLGLLTPDPSEAGQASGGIRPAAGVASPGDVPGGPGQATASGTPSPADRVAPPSEGVSAGQTTLHPQPGLAQLGSLLAGVEAAGLPVEFSANGHHRDLPPGVDLAAYRVMQEALTNVIKHAGRARTHARLDYQPAELIIEIANDAPPPGGDPAAEPGTGRGLIGMRERAALYGGTLDAGPRPGGGWRVRAKIPTRSGPCAARAVPTAAGLDGAAT